MILSIDSLHIWLIALLTVGQTTGILFNQPKLCPFATWNPNAITFANANTIGTYSIGIFVNRNNTVFVTTRNLGKVLIWFEGNMTVTKITNCVSSYTIGVFGTTNNDIYIDNGYIDGKVYKWSRNGISPVTAMYVSDVCHSLFVDINNSLYCCLGNLHIVVRKLFTAGPSSITTIAGDGSAGSASYRLNNPRGIFVDSQLNLYVADRYNNRVQLFMSNKLSGTTVAGNGAPGTIVLNSPTGVVLDADSYLFIADYDNHRIVGSGPNGFRCIVGCTGSHGSASNQLYHPWGLSFDSYGNLFVTDTDNNRVQKFFLATNTCALSFNQPKLCASATWNPNATTFADSSSVGSIPIGIFVNTNNSVYVAAKSLERLQVWQQENMTAMTTITNISSITIGLFVNTNNDIFIDNGFVYGRVDKWVLNATSPVTAMYVNHICYSLFVDVYENLYCSLGDLHKVIRKLFFDSPNLTTIIAGNGVPGSSSYMLNAARGIFVDTNLNLYVADLVNNRIQLFTPGNLSGKTVAGNGAPGTIDLNWPTGVALDADGYLFIIEFYNHRIVGSSANGFRCIVGCTGTAGSASDQMLYPWSFSFDTFGNLFVTDTFNNRTQKFLLATNSCGISYNQPILSSCASWNPNAVTVANSSGVGVSPTGVFVSVNNAIYSVGLGINHIQAWLGGSGMPLISIANALNAPHSVFGTIDNDIYVDNGGNGRVEKWTNNGTRNVTAMYVEGVCYSLVVDIDNNLYCCLGLSHKVVKKAYKDDANTSVIVAGNGTAGSTSDMLSNPTGIYVDINLNLYVADCSNNRVQLFNPGSLNGTSVVGDGAPGTPTLRCPQAVALDGNGYLFVLEYHNPRIIGSSSSGFRCIVGCTNTNGSAANQMFRPWSFSFDSFGNIYVADTLNNRTQKFVLVTNSCDVSYNQPKFSSCARWNPNATTFANNSILGKYPYSVFVNINNTVYVSDNASQRIHIWSQGIPSSTSIISRGLNTTYSLFVTINGDIYIDNGHYNHRVDKWTLNSTSTTTVMYVDGFCRGLFVDISNTLYCSMGIAHLVIKGSLYSDANATTIAAGNGSNGSAPNMLSDPRGIFVDTTFNLYVAECGNNRIQLFQPDNLTGATVAGNDAVGTVSLNCPIGIVLDGDGYLFIVDSGNRRVVGSGADGFRCIVGCTGTNGSDSDQFALPYALSFDSYGNLFVADIYNHRIQKFLFIDNTCVITPTTTSKTTLGNQSCFAPTIMIIPRISSLVFPLQFQHNQDFYISSNVQFNCDSSLSAIMEWKIKSCTPNCSSQIPLDQTIATTFSELYIPASTLPYDVYELQLTVTMTISSSLTSSASAYVKINPSGITANLVRFGTSMITSGHEQDLILDPGKFSVNYDENTFNASDWDYDYYCRIYGLFNFPNILGTLLPIDDPRVYYSQNLSCLSTQSGNGTPWQYNGVNASSKSSVTIRSRSLASNQTYQFMVRMENRRNTTSQAIGYLLVRVDDTRPQMILIACVISTMCTPNKEFQIVNPTTQVALFSICGGNCPALINITWNIYQGFNGSLSTIQWKLFNQTNQDQNNWFFGRNTTNFTAIDRLFIENPQTVYWRFEVVYAFISEISSSALNFIINQPPSNGSCSIDPPNGTTSTRFDISCPDWFDQDGIKDYSIYSYTMDRAEQVMIAYGRDADFTVYLPACADNTSLLYLIVYIRDTQDSIAKFNMTSVVVTLDSTGIDDLINTLENPTDSMTHHPLIRLLSTGNPYTIGQVISTFSQSFNKINMGNIENAISNGISAASISISSLGSQNTQTTTIPLNISAQFEYNKQLNSYAGVRDYLITFATNLPITTSSSIKLQASSLAQLTQATNQLTRTSSMIVSKKCYQLAQALYSMSTEISYEDMQTASSQLAQCASNVLSAINGPLQQRTNVLDSDSSSANALPADYDTDLGSEWANPNLFADGNDFFPETIQKNRNIYYQKQIANQIVTQTTETISLLTNALKIHLNRGQNLTMNTSSVFMSLETLSTESLANKIIQQIGDAQIHLPANFQVKSTENLAISLRSMMQTLAPAADSPNTNLSRSVSLSVYDHNGNEIPISSTGNQSIEIMIPRDPSLVIPSMNLQNVTSLNSTPHYQLFNLHFVNITSKLPISVHLEIHPLDTSLAYLLIYKFDSSPQLNSSISNIDGWSLLCPSNLTAEDIYGYFIDNQRTITHQSVIFGLRELNSLDDCFNYPINNPPISNKPFHFSANYELRVYTSGCYYLDENNNWQSDGLTVGPRTNYQFTQCFSTHLTTFTSGFSVLPASINWNYAFSNQNLPTNQTIYLTTISIAVIYLSMIMYARYKNRKNHRRSTIFVRPSSNEFSCVQRRTGCSVLLSTTISFVFDALHRIYIDQSVSIPKKETIPSNKTH